MKLIQTVRWFASYLVYDVQDVLIVGLPKTATTWLKTTLLEIKKNEEFDTYDQVNSIALEYGSPVFSVLKSASPRVIKTHKPRNMLHNKHEVVLGLKRNLLDNVVSYYIYMAAQNQSVYEMGILEFVKKYKIIKWFVTFYKSWDSYVTSWIDFDDIRDERFDVIAKSLSTSLSISEDALLERLKKQGEERSRQRSKHSLEQKNKFVSGFSFVGDSPFKEQIKARISDSELREIEVLLSAERANR